MYIHTVSGWYVKKEISVLVRSLKSCILSSTSFQMDKTFCGVVSAAVSNQGVKPAWMLKDMGNLVQGLTPDPLETPSQIYLFQKCVLENPLLVFFN